jgi:hypothetical protein
MHLLWQLNGKDYYSIYSTQEVEGLKNLTSEGLSLCLSNLHSSKLLNVKHHSQVISY